LTSGGTQIWPCEVSFHSLTINGKFSPFPGVQIILNYTVLWRFNAAARKNRFDITVGYNRKTMYNIVHAENIL